MFFSKEDYTRTINDFLQFVKIIIPECLTDQDLTDQIRNYLDNQKGMLHNADIFFSNSYIKTGDDMLFKPLTDLIKLDKKASNSDLITSLFVADGRVYLNLDDMGFAYSDGQRQFFSRPLPKGTLFHYMVTQPELNIDPEKTYINTEYSLLFSPSVFDLGRFEKEVPQNFNGSIIDRFNFNDQYKYKIKFIELFIQEDTKEIKGYKTNLSDNLGFTVHGLTDSGGYCEAGSTRPQEIAYSQKLLIPKTL